MIEFFNHHSSLTPEPDMVKKDGRYFSLSEILTNQEAQCILQMLMENRKSREIIMKMREYGITGSIALVRRFKACNWDKLERIPDISNENQLAFEYVECGFKGANNRCPFSAPLDPKPFCVIKNTFNIPFHAKNNSNHGCIAG
jgi:hypothetical protein